MDAENDGQDVYGKGRVGSLYGAHLPLLYRYDWANMCVGFEDNLVLFHYMCPSMRTTSAHGNYIYKKKTVELELA